MTKEAVKSDVLDAVQHEHAHLRKLFDDIADTFRDIRDGATHQPAKKEAVEMAKQNLEMALDEMLEHFDEEEEVLFVAIEERYPDLEGEIQALVDAHEKLCEKTRWLQRQMRAEHASVFEDIDAVLRVIDEQQLFDRVLEALPEWERKWLLEEMKHI